MSIWQYTNREFIHDLSRDEYQIIGLYFDATNGHNVPGDGLYFDATNDYNVPEDEGT